MNSHKSKPQWIRARIPSGRLYHKISALLEKERVGTVCKEALCPNVSDCWGEGTATVMLLGNVCTRRCRFCAVRSGNPKGEVDEDEPARVARWIQAAQLKYVVLTSVDRDDLFDGGAAHFAKTIIVIRQCVPDVLIEALIPDFSANGNALEKLLDARPTVMGHNVETVERLTPLIRDPRANYKKSLGVLAIAKKTAPQQWTKSSIMVGLGETEEEIFQTLSDLRNVGVDFVTIGQYLQPTHRHLQVAKYYTPDEFAGIKEEALKFNFSYVACAPLVRSSYRAFGHYLKALEEISH